ncbi:MAG: energy-coupling factor transporter transmembrane component T family protein [Candidatus Muiribacteriota bacterium]
MNNGILMGQYVPGKSYFYKLNPLNKIIFALFFMILILVVSELKMIFSMFLGVLILFLSAGLPFISVIKGMRSIFFFLLITFIMHIFFAGEGRILYEIGSVTITYEGVFNGTLVFIRLITIIMLNSMLTLTTLPVNIAWGFEKLLYPLKIVRFPVEEFALMLSLALRFIPVLYTELQKIIDSQRSRGADFDSNSFLKKILSFPPVLIPLFVNSFYRAEEIALAMEARCYNGSQGRTHYNKITFCMNDLYFAIFYITAFIILIFYL